MLANLIVIYINRYDNIIGELKKPVDTKMSDFMKLSRWDVHASFQKDTGGKFDFRDTVSYCYRIKEATEKSHRALVKIIKEYQDILDRPVTELFVLDQEISDPHKEQQQQPPQKGKGAKGKGLKGATPLELQVKQPTYFISACQDSYFAEPSTASGQSEEFQQLYQKLPNIFKVMKKLVKRHIVAAPQQQEQQPQLLSSCANEGVQSVEELSGTIIERSNELQQMTSKKHRSAKKLAWTQLLKALNQQYGLSYRAISISQVRAEG
jgi:hypothetical protein